MEGSCECFEEAVADSRQWMVLQFVGLGEVLATGVIEHFTRSRVLSSQCVRFPRLAENIICLNYKDPSWYDVM